MFMTTTDIVLYQSLRKGNFKSESLELLTLVQKDNLEMENKVPEILFITSFPPRECGIATYSQDLINALNNQFSSSFDCVVCALETDSEKQHYKQQPHFILNTDCHNSFLKNAFYINKNQNIKLVVMQHEFGFFAKSENSFKAFFETISKPIVFVFHTVLPKPNEELKCKVQEMAAIASCIIVMTLNAAEILINEYDIAEYKITVIAHGTHLVPPLERLKLKQQYNLVNRKVLTTFGLLSSSKNIESTLQALPTVIAKHPDVLFLAIGKTHPSVVKNEGEKYRLLLEEKVKELQLEQHVRFVNEYLQLPVLLEYLQLTDIYLFTSKDPNQAVSGTFSYAVSCGCPVISTPIPHAKEILKDSNGLIVAFENPPQLAKAINTLLDDEKLRLKISSNSFHKMAATAWQNSAIAHALLFKKLTQEICELQYKLPPIILAHIKKMTTNFGMIQFAKIANPDIFSGFTLDDNARAAVALCQHYQIFENKQNLALIDIYLQFIKHCLQPNGYFKNYVTKHKEFTKQNEAENLEDSTGRAIWALGYISSQKNILPTNLTNEANNLIARAMPHLKNIHSTRAMAFIVKGLYYQNNKENISLIETFANRIMQMYKHEKTTNWHWFEAYLTYGNSILPEAMLCAYECIGKDEYKNIAKESFNFLLSKIFIDGKIKVISNNGWHLKDVTLSNVIGGEQPIDVAYTIIALEKFYKFFNKIEYKQKASLAFSWFLGNNHLNQIVYNPCTGGCYDGVEEHNVNLNQGAESTLSYLMARLAIERLLISENTSTNIKMENLIETQLDVLENTFL
jgi:glycosyltransferase involved in cell wall biosynthesis